MKTIMIYRQNKKSVASSLKIPILAAILLFFLFAVAAKKNASGILAKGLKILLPEREMVLESQEIQILMSQIGDLKKENARLNEALGVKSGVKKIPARILLKNNYIFEDTIFLDKGENAGIERGDIVVSESAALLGVISEVGETWSKANALGKLGQRLTARIRNAEQAPFELAGAGSGELRGQLSANLGNITVGAMVLWGENPNYIIGFVDALDTDRDVLTVSSVLGLTHNLLNIFIVKKSK